jgi:branched-chain amino acid aminotransferase
MQPNRGAGRGVKRVCFVDGARATEDAALPLRDHGVLLGDSIFETMRAYGGRPFMLEQHLDRLYRSAVWARMTISGDREKLAEEITLAAREVGGDAAVRIFVTRGARPIGEPLVHVRTRRIVLAETIEDDTPIVDRAAHACTLPFAEFGTHEGAYAKYARYLPRLLARDEARIRGKDEAILVDDEGNIVEAATGSVFVVVGDTVITSTILEGLTRQLLLVEARDMWLGCALRPITRDDVEHANEMFVTSSLREVVPIVSIDDRPVGDGTVGEKTRALHAALRRHAERVT